MTGRRRSALSRRPRTALRVVLLGAALLLASAPAVAYPEFEVFIEARSGRWVNCAFCHTNPDGPEGVKPGQIRSLSPAELERLNRARRAFEPGSDVDSPILNDFGDRMLHELGKRRILQLRVEDPGGLAELLRFFEARPGGPPPGEEGGR